MLNYLQDNYPPGCQRERQPREAEGTGTDRPDAGEADPDTLPEAGRPKSKARSSAGSANTGNVGSEGLQQSADSAAAPAPSEEVPMEVEAAPELGADESPEEEVTLEAEIIPDYDLPDYDE